MSISTTPPSSGSLADWDLAAKVGWTVAQAGLPKVSREQVEDLRARIDAAVAQADPLARAATGVGADLPPATARVIGRREWIRSNLASLAYLTAPVADQLASRGAMTRAMARRTLAVQLGAVLGYLSTRVLGQYEVFLPGGEEPGRLTLVGPNLIELERTLLPGTDVSAQELHLGICLHEIAHRLQFEGVPWLRGQLRGLLDDYLEDTRLDPDRVRQVVAKLAELVRDPGRLLDLQELLKAVLTPRQAEVLARAQALMSLLEGHGNVVMDWGAELASEQAGITDFDPSKVRDVLNRRRSRPADQALRRAMGLSMKAEQYRIGERFILDVAERHGRDAFNRVWQDPEHVPTGAELEDADAWAARVVDRS